LTHVRILCRTIILRVGKLVFSKNIYSTVPITALVGNDTNYTVQQQRIYPPSVHSSPSCCYSTVLNSPRSVEIIQCHGKSKGN